MVESTPSIQELQNELQEDEFTEAEYQRMKESLPERTEEEVEADWEEWLQHPLNCKELTPAMMEREEFQALQAM